MMQNSELWLVSYCGIDISNKINTNTELGLITTQIRLD